MTEIKSSLEQAVRSGASDIFLVAGLPLTCRKDGIFTSAQQEKLFPQQCEEIIRALYELAGRPIEPMLCRGDDDFSFALPGVSRFRANVYRQRGSLAAVIRVVGFEIPSPEALGIPDAVMALAARRKGMILVTGPAGSGKSTTQACLIDRINTERGTHIITLEDPIEFLHSHKKSIVSQREIVSDTENYVTALRASLRQAPDVILLGEMRDAETIATAMTAAETGHLVISTLHTVGAANAVDRVIDAFPPSQQTQIRFQLSQILEAVVSQQMVPLSDQKDTAVFELLLVNTAVRNMIREGKSHQLEAAMAADPAMFTMDQSLTDLVKAGRLDAAHALQYSLNPDALSRRLGI